MSKGMSVSSQNEGLKSEIPIENSHVKFHIALLIKMLECSEMLELLGPQQYHCLIDDLKSFHILDS